MAFVVVKVTRVVIASPSRNDACTLPLELIVEIDIEPRCLWVLRHRHSHRHRRVYVLVDDGSGVSETDDATPFKMQCTIAEPADDCGVMRDEQERAAACSKLVDTAVVLLHEASVSNRHGLVKKADVRAHVHGDGEPRRMNMPDEKVLMADLRRLPVPRIPRYRQGFY